ncbi:MAG: gliding motility lipoprotein GldD [Bacteroidota bacterium]
MKKVIYTCFFSIKRVALGAVVILLAVIFTGCKQDFTPKPKGYNRFDLPEHAYQSLPDSLPYHFEYSKHAKLLRDSSWISDPRWVEIYYPELKANIHITYKEILNQDSLKEYLNDAHFLTSKHQIKSYAIDETISQTPLGKTVVYAELDGEVPSPFQFFSTDSSYNFLRGALYFNTQVNNDSLKPAMEYVKIDIVHMMNNLTWQSESSEK